jgi:integrase
LRASDDTSGNDEKPLSQAALAGSASRLAGSEIRNIYRMIARRALAAEVRTKIGCHSFRATGITEYLRNGGKLEIAQQMANHESSRTTGLYDRRQDQVSLDEVERIVI